MEEGSKGHFQGDSSGESGPGDWFWVEVRTESVYPTRLKQYLMKYVLLESPLFSGTRAGFGGGYFTRVKSSSPRPVLKALVDPRGLTREVT